MAPLFVVSFVTSPVAGSACVDIFSSVVLSVFGAVLHWRRVAVLRAGNEVTMKAVLSLSVGTRRLSGLLLLIAFVL